jgi:hypothetical protein
MIKFLPTVSFKANFRHSTSNLIKSDLVDESLRLRFDLTGDGDLDEVLEELEELMVETVLLVEGLKFLSRTRCLKFINKNCCRCYWG